MPTKNTIRLGAGTLYIRHPETGERAQLGRLKSLEITEPVKFTDLDVVNPCLTVPHVDQEVTVEIEQTPETWEAFQKLCLEPLAKAWASYIKDLAQTCVTWCKEHHPAWFHILRQTKKARIRKKYINRLCRAFLEEAVNK